MRDVEDVIPYRGKDGFYVRLQPKRNDVNTSSTADAVPLLPLEKAWCIHNEMAESNEMGGPTCQASSRVCPYGAKIFSFSLYFWVRSTQKVKI